MRMLRFATVVLMLAGAAQARAQEQQPFTYYLPPPPPPPPGETIRALELAGRHKILTGNLLLATGGTLALTGVGLLIAGAVEHDHSCVGYHDDYYDRRYYYYGHGYCGISALAFAGGATMLLGLGAIIPGAFIRASGSRDLATAHLLRHGAWSVRPTVTTHGALAELELRF
jgi:hypothetical protein